jgi:hypothetical protein
LERGVYADARSTIEDVVGKRQYKYFGSFYAGWHTWSEH